LVAIDELRRKVKACAVASLGAAMNAQYGKVVPFRRAGRE